MIWLYIIGVLFIVARVSHRDWAGKGVGFMFSHCCPRVCAVLCLDITGPIYFLHICKLGARLWRKTEGSAVHCSSSFLFYEVGLRSENTAGDLAYSAKRLSPLHCDIPKLAPRSCF